MPRRLGERCGWERIIGAATVQSILDQSRQTDLSTAQAMLSLLERGYLVVG